MAKRLDRDADGDWTDAETSVWYRATDTLFSVVAMIDSGGDMYERVEYDAYGNAQHRYYGDVNGDGVFTTSDLFTANGASGITSTKYHADIDTDFDGAYQWSRSGATERATDDELADSFKPCK